MPHQPVPPQQFGPPPGYYPAYPPPRPGMSGGKIALIIVGVVVGVLFLFGLLVGMLAVATIPKLADAKQKLEVKQMSDLNAGLRQVAVDDAKRRRLKELGNSSGGTFWEQALHNQVIDDSLSKKTVSLLGADQPGSQHPVPASLVSYTSPKADKLFKLLSADENSHFVLITWNSRNWRNMEGKQVPVVWSNRDTAEWLTFEQAQADWGITKAEWDDPAGKLFGKKAPFGHTYE